MAATIGGLVSRGWLNRALSEGAKQLKVLDASWTATASGRDEYLSSHVPRATFFDVNNCIPSTPFIPRNLPDLACFTDYVRSLGVNQDDHLVLYDRGNTLPAARVWWTFRAFGHSRVSVLNGGFKHWVNAAYPVESGPSPTDQPTGNFKIDFQKNLFWDFERVKSVIGDDSWQIVDARLPKNFSGEAEEPSDASLAALNNTKQPIPTNMHRGHLPGSKNLVEGALLDPDTGLFYERDQLRQLFEGAGVRLDKPLMATCYAGIKACTLALAALECGKDDVGVYLGSWTEWSQRADKDKVARSSKQG